MKSILKSMLIFFISILSLVMIYLGCAWGLSRISTPYKNYQDQNITCYILSNGVHTDLVLPRENYLYNWDDIVSPNNTISKKNNYKYISFGWGDRGFYLETPTWADLKISTALKAGFGLSTTAIHTTYYNNLTPSKKCIKLVLSEEQYLLLVVYIQNSFKTKNNQAKHIITNANYGNNDTFYEGNGTYSILKTCNTWANNGLKSAQISTALWTPFDSGILYHFTND